jgi:hypothetical protein
MQDAVSVRHRQDVGSVAAITDVSDSVGLAGAEFARSDSGAGLVQAGLRGSCPDRHSGMPRHVEASGRGCGRRGEEHDAGHEGEGPGRQRQRGTVE